MESEHLQQLERHLHARDEPKSHRKCHKTAEGKQEQEQEEPKLQQQQQRQRQRRWQLKQLLNMNL